MTDPVAIQAPIDDTPVIELARSTRLFRKQVLRVGKINYNGHQLDFTSDYLDGLAQAYHERAFDSVPLVFTDEKNAHTQDVERIRGEVLGFERNGDHLDAIVRASNDKAATLLRENPKIGVSVRIEQPLERVDGKRWPAAIQHVLATANPRMTGLAPWQPVDLAADDIAVIDLSTYDFADGEDNREEPAVPDTTKGDTPSPFTDEETARLRALLDSLTEADTASSNGEDYRMPTDEELAEIAAGLFDDDKPAEVAEPEPVAAAALSAEATAALELANSRVDTMSIELARLRDERDQATFERMRDQFATEHGIPPYVTELARPLLTGEHTIELANGANVDAGDIVRQVLLAVAKHARLVDLSRDDVVYAAGSTDEATAAKARQAEATDYVRQFGLG